MHHNIPDVHPAAVISVFHQNVCNRKMREELAMNKVKDVAELYVLANRCARACRISGFGRPLRFEHWGARGDFASYLPAPLRLAKI